MTSIRNRRPIAFGLAMAILAMGATVGSAVADETCQAQTNAKIAAIKG